jgi:glucosamine--fructose-6-phosphate aminotransferase (isomerizing)
MCGIVGASSTRNIVPVLIDGIKRLEYRGYDSTGLASSTALRPSPGSSGSSARRASRISRRRRTRGR